MSINDAESVVDGRRGKRRHNHKDEREDAELIELLRLFGNIVLLAICQLFRKMFSCITRKKVSA